MMKTTTKTVSESMGLCPDDFLIFQEAISRLQLMYAIRGFPSHDEEELVELLGMDLLGRAEALSPEITEAMLLIAATQLKIDLLSGAETDERKEACQRVIEALTSYIGEKR